MSPYTSALHTSKPTMPEYDDDDGMWAVLLFMLGESPPLPSFC